MNRKTKIIITHCQRRKRGGEDIAIEKISKFRADACTNIYAFDNSFFLSLIRFFFSLEYLFFVLRRPYVVHVLVNPFPQVSFLSILILMLFPIKLRLYIHNFSLSCPANTHFKGEQPCFRCVKSKTSVRTSCFPNKFYIGLALLRNKIFYTLFLLNKRNKIYFVSEYQKFLAIESGLFKRKCLVVGNIV